MDSALLTPVEVLAANADLASLVVRLLTEVDQLRADGHALVSLMAESADGIVGHVLFGRMWIQTASGLLPAVALAPLSVLPELQRKGIGGRLVQDCFEGRKNFRSAEVGPLPDERQRAT